MAPTDPETVPETVPPDRPRRDVAWELFERHVLGAEEAPDPDLTELLAAWRAAGFAESELLHLAAFLAWRFGKDRYAVRAADAAAPWVQEVTVGPEELVLASMDGKRFAYHRIGGTFRWTSRGGDSPPFVSRADIESALGVWPGYLDGIEASCRAVWQFRRECVQECEQVHLSVGQAVQEAQIKASLDRHPQLSRWRAASSPPSTEPPESLKGVRHLRRLEVRQPCHVYFLVHQSEVVYVGQTASAWPGRILQHLDDPGKEFDDVWYLEVDRQSLDAVERAYIEQFRPKYNRAGLRKVVAA